MIIILCTIPNNMVIAHKIIKTLLDNKLAACITILNKAQSFYYWNNEIQSNTEIQLFIKTRNSLRSLVFNKIKAIHPYEVPELLALNIISGDTNYLSWIQNATTIQCN